MNHLLRTTRPELTDELITVFENYKKQIFATCLNLNPDNISDTHWNQCGLAIANGGMGLGNLADAQHSAYAASIIACYHTSMKEQFGLAYQMHNGGTIEGTGRTNVPIASFVEVFERFHLLDPEAFPDIDAFLSLKVETRLSIQSKLTQHLIDSRHKQFKDSLVGPLIHHGCWFTSLEHKDAGRWLTVVPKHSVFIFNNSQFQTQLRVRLFMEIGKMHEGTICDCKRRTRVDKNGHHFISGCGMQGLVSDQHDAMVLELSHMAGYCGMNTRREPLGCFHGTEPDNGKKPDLVILNPMISELLPALDGCNSKLILDVMYTNPVPGSQKGVYTHMSPYIAHKVEHAADKAFNYKIHKYATIAADNGLSFLPIIFESTGRPHKDVVKFVQSMAEDAAEVKKLDPAIIYGYVMNRLSCAFQKGISNTINTRVATLNGHLTRAATQGCCQVCTKYG